MSLVNDDPVELASAGGARSSSWHRVGDGRWEGSVVDGAGKEYPVAETSTGWTLTRKGKPALQGKSLTDIVRKALPT